MSIASSAQCLRCIGRTSLSSSRSSTWRAFSKASRQEASLNTTSSSSPPIEPTLTRQTSTPVTSTPLQTDPSESTRRQAVRKELKDPIPFEQLPYECFQEARKILQADREEKLGQIEIQRGRIARLVEQDASVSGGNVAKRKRLESMRQRLEELKILADINDPLVKKRFEDGLGDMDKPIYRHLAYKKWIAYKRKVAMQRITQMSVIPDVLPSIEPILDVDMNFDRVRVQPGNFIMSTTSERTPTFNVQSFAAGERLYTVAVIDPDIPNIDTDNFDHKCLFLATNVPISPTSPKVDVASLPDASVAHSWLPPVAQMGAPYHRISAFILRQPHGTTIDVEALKGQYPRDNLWLRDMVKKHSLRPMGVTMFRSMWDEGTDGVMERAGIEGVDMEFQRPPPEKLPYKKKPGWKFR
ncbi:PEBP-like protein [Eremomyces bilateralis CBS 781.70]|uniref:Large ribosomal subunit protein mL38 n=1 Tax=Eremomyces bilateralis CBS 781.70 TaxID=1392243 RepID=A0A6G1GA87_9PEZI|nr:PEBP-like protein [Eremomyces bilateralis CBS 781.70]KAF1814944.1 PEBP-like protein [Eremomyces bilateralis CBS 781.70]